VDSIAGDAENLDICYSGGARRAIFSSNLLICLYPVHQNDRGSMESSHDVCESDRGRRSMLHRFVVGRSYERET
jgi:hypothetical protein